MRQVLFHIPGIEIPIYGYGFMLFLAFIGCVWLASRLARPHGVPHEAIQDLCLWIFITGIIGARITYMIQYGVPLVRFFQVWDGGLVFYGSMIGGAVGFVAGHHFLIRRHNVSLAHLADIAAPCVALGLCLGRIGCLLNGCCYGHVACENCPAISFPFPSPPRYDMTARGYQSAAGFTMDEKTADGRTVGHVEPGSPAERAGLKKGDVIVQAEGREIKSYADLLRLFLTSWPRGQHSLHLTVERAGRRGRDVVELEPFEPRTIGLHPTQPYETISTGLLLFLLLSYLPFKHCHGELAALFLIGYAIHRFINESLRTDTEPVAFGLTLSQNLSIVALVMGLAIGLRCWVFRPAAAPVPENSAKAPGPPQPEQALQD